jgi:hypothetical protein
MGMRKIIAISLAFCINIVPLLGTVASVYGALPQPQENYYPPAGAYPQGNPGYQVYTPEQLDNLLAPIALYPDPLLAQVLPAATFVDQIQQAAGWVQSYGQNGIEEQPWDVSIKAVAHYPMVVEMMANRLDWTTALGQAYVSQSTDVMTAVQRLRSMARAQGNLYSTPQQRVIYQGGYTEIIPAQPQYLYVPTYDPAVIYVQHHGFGTALAVGIAFGAGMLIGAWLNHDVDWHSHRIYYDGWSGGGNGGWRNYSRQYVQINNTYVNNTYNNITVNKAVVSRPVNVGNLSNYRAVYQNVSYSNVVHNNAVARMNPASRQPAAVAPRTPVGRPAYGQPSANPAYHPPTAQPTYRQPAANPAYHPPTPQPTYRQPAVNPAYHPPTAQPTYQRPGANPAYHPPTAQPENGQPATNPAYQPRSAQRGYERPAASPTYRPQAAQPASRPTVSQPANHPPAQRTEEPRQAASPRAEPNRARGAAQERQRERPEGKQESR